MLIYVKEENIFNRAKLRKFYTQLNNCKKTVKFYEIEQIKNNELLKENINEVEKIVDQILEAECINNVA